MKNKISKKIYWFIGIGLAVVALIAYLVINGMNTRNQAMDSLQTYTVQRGDLTAIVGATGMVHANQTAVILWQTSGVVGTINVAIGDSITSGTVLAELKQTSLPQSVILAQADLVTVERNLDNLKNSDLNRSQAQLNLANAKDAYDKAIWFSLNQNVARTTNQDQSDAARTALYLAEDAVQKAEDFYDNFDGWADNDPDKAAALNTLANARLNRDNAQNNLDYLIETPDDTELAISDAKIAVALAQYEDAQREWERQQNGTDPKDIAAAEARIAAIQATIDTARLSAPFAGTVTDIAAMAGDQVSPGLTAFRVDDLSHLLVDVQIPEVDINRVLVGQSVDLTFDAISAKQYKGTVTQVARVGTVEAGMVNFKVTVELQNPDDKVLPGMTAAVNIITTQLSNVLTIPNRAVRLQDNKQVIYLLKNGVITPVEIAIGASSDTLSEVASGDIKEGDVVVLNPPTDFTQFSGGPPF